MIVFPGDELFCIEEYENGDNTIDDGNGIIRATTIGVSKTNNKDHVVMVKSKTCQLLPKPGDVIIGVVVSIVASMLVVLIEYVNNKLINSKIECVFYTRNIKKKTTALVNDVVMLKIISYKNGAIHTSMNEADMGVIFTICRKCGGQVVSIKDSIKCIDCSWIDERKISKNFGSTSFIKLN